MISLDDMKKSGVLKTNRRTLLKGFLATYSASLIPWAIAAPANSADQQAFLDLSTIITGRSKLDTDLAGNLYQALVANDPAFTDRAKELLARVNKEKIDPLKLQKVLDDEKSPLATMPRIVANAWFMGVVGGGGKARCIAYENALNAQIVADTLKPPTYAYGPYGSWSRNPKKEASNG
jgi:hypothetical protein